MVGDSSLAEALSKHYGDVQALVDMDLRVRNGEVFGFTGPVATDYTKDIMQVGGPTPFARSQRVKRPEEVVRLALWLARQSFSLAR